MLGGFQFPSSVGSDWNLLPSLALPSGTVQLTVAVLQATAAQAPPVPSGPDTRPGVPALCRVPVSLADEEGGAATSRLTSYIPAACRTVSPGVKLSCLSHYNLESFPEGQDSSLSQLPLV